MSKVNELSDRVRHKFLDYRPAFWKVIEACVLASAISAIFFFTPLAVSCETLDSLPMIDAVSAKSDTASATGSINVRNQTYIAFNCGNGTYNPMATLMLGGPNQGINLLLDKDPSALGIGVVAIFGLIIFVTTSISYGSYVPGGLFTPGLIMGACCKFDRNQGKEIMASRCFLNLSSLRIILLSAFPLS